MSFKRDGDDSGALNNQRKRRVAELLCEDVEGEELSKLSNGKFVCKLCSHKPIFDTVAMFFVHKQGKKHLASLNYAATQKQELADLIAKRNHEQLSKMENNRTLQVAAGIQSNPNGRDQFSFVQKKQKTKRFDRKKIVDLDIATESESDVPIATTVEELPGNRVEGNVNTLKFRQKSDNYESVPRVYNSSLKRSDMSVNADAQHKHYQLNKDENKTKLKQFSENSFKSKFSTGNLQNNDDVIESKNVHKLVGNIETEHRNKFYLARKKQKVECINDITSQLRKPGTSTTNDINVQSPYQTWNYYKNLKRGHVKLPKGDLSKRQMRGSLTLESTSVDGSMHTDTIIKNDGVIPRNTMVASTSIKPEKAEKMLQAFGSGWKKDWTGQWVKDEEAEFDTDEETPDI